MTPETPVVETPQPETAEPTAQPEAASIADHAKQFDPARRAEAAADVATAEATESTDDAIHHSELQRRDRPTGKFAEGKKRNPVKRINELTGRAKTAEEQLAAANAELARLRQPTPQGNGRAPQAPIPQQAPQQAVAPQPPPQPQIQRAPPDPRDPEPQQNDPLFRGDYGAYLRGVSAWEAREQYRQIAFQQYLGQQQQAQTQADANRKTFWQTRLEKAKTDHPDDFEQVAFGTVTPWEKDSLVDALIEKHDNGVELLYYLQSHPGERDSILQMPEAKQVVALSQILLRWESNGAQPTGGTGSVASPNIRYLPPRPVNPVRTEAQRASGGPPPTDGSLSIAEHQKRFGMPTRRR